MAKTTEELENDLKSIQTSEALEKWMDLNRGSYILFCDCFKRISDEKGVRPADLVGKIALSKAYIYAVAKGEKVPSKKAVIMIALGMGATVEETNLLLKSSGNKELYPKKEEDSVIEFGIRNGWTVYQIEELLEKRGLHMKLTDGE